MKYRDGYTFIGDMLKLYSVKDLGKNYYIFKLNKDIPVGFIIKSQTFGSQYLVVEKLRPYNGIRLKVKKEGKE